MIKLDRIAINYTIEVIMGLSFITLATTGALKWPGLLQNYGYTLDTSPLSWISIIHHSAGLVMIAMVLLHLIMHWRFIYSMTKYYLFGEERV